MGALGRAGGCLQCPQSPQAQMHVEEEKAGGPGVTSHWPCSGSSTRSRRGGAAWAGGFMGGGSAGAKGRAEDMPQGQGPSCLQCGQGPGDPLWSLLPWASTSGPLARGSGRGRSWLRWAQLGGTDSLLCTGQPAPVPMEPQPGGPGAAQGLCGWGGLLAQHGVCREPWQCWLCTEQGSLSCPGKGQCCSCLSPLQQDEFLVSLVLCELPGVGEAGPVSCLLAVACGTAAERGTTNPKRVVILLQ